MIVFALVAALALSSVTDVEIVPVDGSIVNVGDVGSYSGTVHLKQVGGVVAVTERVTLDEYLLGIREVPFSWPEEALEAQAVAARTYLARTMARGPSEAGARFGFDICASDQCQVYRGVPEGEDIDRWRAAIADTSGEMILYEGSPALTLYSSSAGPRTRAVQDVFGGDPLPYLQPVDSPEAGVTPFEAWQFDVPSVVLGSFLRAAGYGVDGVAAVVLQRPPEASGPASLAVDTDRGRLTFSVSRFRAIFNRWGPQLFPGLYPALRADGLRLPQALPSYTFDIEFRADPLSALDAYLPEADRADGGMLRIVGSGWGHGVGMSQWGANAMARAGAGHDEILAHYFGGLEPVAATEFVPDLVEVGLSWDRAAVAISADGPFLLKVNGVAFGGASGTWEVRSTASGLALVGPAEQAGLAEVIAGRRWPR